MGKSVRIGFRSGLKKGICSLICFLMVAAAASLWNMFSFDAFAGGGKSVDLHVTNDFNKVRENFNKTLTDACLKEANVINIILDQDIQINPDSNFSKIVGMGNGYLFDFTSNKFKNKTINIKSNGKNVFRIKNKNGNIGFLKARSVTVNLENVEALGGAVYKEYKIPSTKIKVADDCVNLNRNFINISDNSVLSLNDKSAVRDVYISNAEYHVIYLNDSQLNLNGGVSGCRIESENGCPAGGAVYADNQSSVIMNAPGYITRCSVFQPELAKGGAICLDNGSMLHIKSGGHIYNCCVAADYAVGGAISAEHKCTVIMEKGSKINNCSVVGNNSCGGAMFIDVESCLDLKGGEISDCSAKKYGDAIYFAGGGEYKTIPPGGDLKITIPKNLNNSHNLDAGVLGYRGIYKFSLPVKKEVGNEFKASKVVSAKKPVVANKPIDVRKPVSARKPADVRKPVSARKPADVRKPGAVRKPVDFRKPVSARKPADVRKPV